MRMALALMLTLLSLSASAQIIGGQIKGGQNAGGGGGSGSTCPNGQLDWSDATGCNLTLYMIGIR